MIHTIGFLTCAWVALSCAAVGAWAWHAVGKRELFKHPAVMGLLGAAFVFAVAAAYHLNRM